MPLSKSGASRALFGAFVLLLAGCSGGDDAASTGAGAGGHGARAVAGGGAGGTGGNASGGGAGGTASREGPFELAGAVTLADGLGYPTRLTLHGDYIYFTTRGPWPTGSAGTVSRLPKAGGPVEVLLDGLDAAAGIAIADDDLYFAVVNGRAIGRMDLEGGASEVFHVHSAPLYEVALDGSRLLYTHFGGAVVLDRETAAEIAAASVGEGTARIAMHDGLAYVTARGAPEAASGGVHEVDPLSGSTRALATEQARPEGVTVDGDAIYFANQGVRPDPSVPLTGGGVFRLHSDGRVELIEASDEEPFAVVADRANLYYSRRNAMSGGTEDCDLPSGSIIAIDKQSGSSRVLASGLICPSTLVVDDEALYWVTNGREDLGGGGSVMRAEKRYAP